MSSAPALCWPDLQQRTSGLHIPSAAIQLLVLRCSGSGLCSKIYVLRQFGRIADLNFYPEVDNIYIFYPGCSPLSMMQLSSPSCSNKVVGPRGERTCEEGLAPVHGGVMGFAFLLLLQDLWSRALWRCPC